MTAGHEVLCLGFPTPTPGPNEATHSHCPGCCVGSRQLLSQVRHFQLSGPSCLPGVYSTSPVPDSPWAEPVDCVRNHPKPLAGVVGWTPARALPPMCRGVVGRLVSLPLGPQGKGLQPQKVGAETSSGASREAGRARAQRRQRSVPLRGRAAQSRARSSRHLQGRAGTGAAGGVRWDQGG